MALDNLVSETLLDEAADNAGIQTSGSQLSFYILENPVNPRIQEIMQTAQRLRHERVNSPAGI